MWSVEIVWAPKVGPTKEIFSVFNDLQSAHNFVDQFKRDIDVADGRFYNSIIAEYSSKSFKQIKTIENDGQYN